MKIRRTARCKSQCTTRIQDPRHLIFNCRLMNEERRRADGLNVRLDPSFRFNLNTILQKSYEDPRKAAVTTEMMADMHKRLISWEEEDEQMQTRTTMP